MLCNRFEELVTDYLEGQLEPRMRAECGSHRLICRQCRELYNDVRLTVRTLNLMGQFDEGGGSDAFSRLADGGSSRTGGLTDRILSVTMAGEMLRCSDFDTLLEQYFDGVLLAPTYQTFQQHFEGCRKCRRLISGIEETITLCREIGGTEIRMDESLPSRIVAVTTCNGGRSWGAGRLPDSWLVGLRRLLTSPQIAAAMLILAASLLLILSRFGSVEGMASHVESRADLIVAQSHQALNETESAAIVNLERFSQGVNTLFPEDNGEANDARRKKRGESGR